MFKKVIFFLLIYFLTLTLFTGCNQDEENDKTTTTKVESSKELEIGDKAEDFSLKNQDQLNISLNDFKNKKNVIIVFYPADFTPV